MVASWSWRNPGIICISCFASLSFARSSIQRLANRKLFGVYHKGIQGPEVQVAEAEEEEGSIQNPKCSHLDCLSASESWAYSKTN